MRDIPHFVFCSFLLTRLAPDRPLLAGQPDRSASISRARRLSTLPGAGSVRREAGVFQATPAALNNSAREPVLSAKARYQWESRRGNGGGCGRGFQCRHVTPGQEGVRTASARTMSRLETRHKAFRSISAVTDVAESHCERHVAL